MQLLGMEIIDTYTHIQYKITYSYVIRCINYEVNINAVFKKRTVSSYSFVKKVLGSNKI